MGTTRRLGFTSTRLSILLSLATLLLSFGVAAAPPASAAAGETSLCSGWDYGCLAGTGYTGQSVWGSWGPGHNCVSYAAYRLQQNGVPAKPWDGVIGNARDWDENARGAGIAVDGNPAVGSIAQWDAPYGGGYGHIAYVESVTPSSIEISEDSYLSDTSGYSSRRRLDRSGSTYGAAEFIHVKDMPSTSSSAYELAFQANTGELWTVGSDPHGRWPLGMLSGTSPSITALPGGGWQMAFQANTGQLYSVGSGGNQNWGYGMTPGTSPSIVALASGGYEIAFQANTGELWTIGSDPHGRWDLGMMRDTSPSITALPGGGYQVAVQANTGQLISVGSGGNQNWGYGMMTRTSPSIVALASGGYEIAFQANTGELWTIGSDAHGTWNYGMMSGTSPSIAATG